MFIAWLRNILTNPIEESDIQLDTLHVKFNRYTRTAYMELTDPNTPPDAYVGWEAHMKKQGWYVIILVPSVAVLNEVIQRPRADTVIRQI